MTDLLLRKHTTYIIVTSYDTYDTYISKPIKMLSIKTLLLAMPHASNAHE